MYCSTFDRGEKKGRGGKLRGVAVVAGAKWKTEVQARRRSCHHSAGRTTPRHAAAFTRVLKGWSQAKEDRDAEQVDRFLKWKKVLPALLTRRKQRTRGRGRQRKGVTGRAIHGALEERRSQGAG
jgi:hypothetical protein